MLAIIIFFLGHWYLSLTFQTLYLHRYASHGQFQLSLWQDRLMHLGNLIFQGSSYLTPRGYAIMHQAHHKYADQAKDPHAPGYYTNVLSMMISTAKTFISIVDGKHELNKEFVSFSRDWPLVEKIGTSWPYRIGMGAFYFFFYYYFAPNPWWFVLLPVHFIMGPVHGSIVNWCGHKYGHRNHDLGDKSTNFIGPDIFLMGELLQNNHHARCMSPKFSERWFEIDPGYGILVTFSALSKIFGKKFEIENPVPRRPLVPDLVQERPSA